MSRGSKILVVEDESIVSLEIQGRIEELGYGVAGAVFSGEDALEFLKDEKPDLILMDINLRGDLDGIETSNIIKEKYDIPVIYMTAYADEDTINRAKVSQPYAYIIKPIEVKELHTSIEISLYKSAMQKKLIESEKQFRGLFENASIGIYRSKLSGELLIANSALMETLGFNDISELNQPFGESFGYTDRNKRKEFFDAVLNNGSISNFEAEWRKKDGSLVFITENARRTSDENGNEIIEGIVENITEKKVAENRLKDSEQILQTIYDHTFSGIIIYDSNGNIRSVNKRILDFLQISKEEILKTNIFQRDISSQELLTLQTIWKKVLGGETYKYETKVSSVNNEMEYDVEVSFTSIMIKNEKCVLGNFRNISEEKKAKIELIKARELLQKVFDNVYNSIILHDLNGEIFDVNEKTLSMFSVNRNDALNSSVIDLLGIDFSADQLKSLWEKALNGENQIFECKAKMPVTNNILDVEVFLTKIALNSKEFLLANIQDISELKEKTKNLLLSQEIMTMQGFPIYWIGTGAKIFFANKAAEKMLGYTNKELLSFSVSDIDPTYDVEYYEKIGFPQLIKNGSLVVETIHRTKDGRDIPVEVASSIINFKDEYVVASLVTDISERKLAAQKLLEAKENAEKSDQLKSDFLAGMSHEIRTPVNTIMNYTSLLKDELHEMGIKHFEDIFHSISFGGKRLIRTVDSILNMSQIQTNTYDVDYKKINLEEEVLLPLYLEFKIEASNKGLEFLFDRESIDVKVNIDSYSVGQLFNNLLDNALKYTNAGFVKIRTHLDEHKNYIVDIIDSGIGISEEFQKNIFNPFTQETQGYTRRFDGNGLGLALVKKYCDLNNAEISLKSKKNEGTTFTVMFKNPVIENYKDTLHS